MRSKLLVALTFCATVIGLAASTPAGATVISVSATDFVRQCTPGCPIGEPQITSGVLRVPNFMIFFHDLELPQGQRVCSLTLVYADTNNSEFVTARLLRKVWVPGSNADNTPIEMARAAGAPGIVAGVRSAVDATVLSNPINNLNSLYYVELTMPNVNLVAQA
jgi:hypothetical protein